MISFISGFLTAILLIIIFLKFYSKKLLNKLFQDSIMKNAEIIYKSVGRPFGEKEKNILKNKLKGV